MIIEKDAYLAHHGVKGMKWGVRRQRTSTGEGDSGKKQLSGKVKFARNATIAIAVGIGAGLVAGKIVGKGIKVNRAQLRHANFAHEKTIANLFGQAGNTPVSHLRPPSGGRPKISPETASFLKKFTADQNNLNKLANGDLKSLYEKGQVPLPLREYLSEWT